MDKYPIIFDKQPKITKGLLADLEKRGLIVPEKSRHTVNPGDPKAQGGRQTEFVSNPTAGDVVGYSILAKKFRDGDISQEDARVLLVIESTREKGPRETHISRLLANVFASNKQKVLAKVEAWARIQAKR